MELLNPTMDFIFKEIFGNEQNKDLLIDFLNAILEYKTPIVNLEYLDTVIQKEYIDNKYPILTINAILSDGLKVNIELQTKDTDNIRQKSIYHWAQNYCVDLKERDFFGDLKGVICINILTYNIYNDEHIHHKFAFYDTVNKVRFDDPNDVLMEVHFVELNKLDLSKKINKTKDSQALINWVTFINDPNLAKTKKLGSTINKALDILTKLSEDKKMRNAYFERHKMLLEETRALNKAKKDGIEEGRKEGIQEGIEKVAINLLDLLEDNVIALKTGLDIEHVRNLRKANNK